MTIRVYLADDHAVVRDGLRALLEGNPDIKVVGDGSDGQQAVLDALALRPDVVILDISMPEVNGIEAARRILAEEPGMRVIILSMLGTAEHIYRALRAGARGYLLKESAGREVVTAVLAVAAGEIYLSQPVQSAMIADYVQVRGKDATGPLDRLSEREREVLRMVVGGDSSAEIGRVLHLSTKTVETYRSRMMHKLGVSDLPGLVKLAMQLGLVTLD